MRKYLLKIALDYITKELKNSEIDTEDRMEGYAHLFTNIKMMNNLEKMLVEDTKRMMTKDCFEKDRYQIGLRHGMFLRTFAVKRLAKQYYEEFNKKISIKK